MGVEVLDQRVNHLIRNQRLAAAVRCWLVPVHRKNALQLFIGGGDRTHCRGELFTEVGRGCQHVTPLAPFRNGETMIAAGTENCLLGIGKLAPLFLLLFRYCLIRLILPLIAEALVKHQRQDVVLVILPGGLAAENIRSTP